jgi:hypothetical protein
MEKINRKSYTLLVGNSSVELFDYFMTDELHGLTREVAELYPDENDSAYIAGMANYHPMDKNLSLLFKPYVFINRRRLNGTYEDILTLNHELLHMARLLAGGINDNNEEAIVTWIEKEIKYIVDNGIIGILQQPSSYLM